MGIGMSDRITIPLYQTGWSSEAPLLDSGAGHLLSCKNYVIKQNLLESRKGNYKVISHSKTVKTIIPIEEYNIMIVCSGGSIYVYQKDAVGFNLVAQKDGYSVDDWRYIYVNHNIIMVNGVDKAQHISVKNPFDDSQTINIVDWNVSPESGSVSTIFDWVALLNAQVVCGYGNDLIAYYLPVGYIQGEKQLKKFDIGSSAGTPKKGGSITGGFNISRDSGESLNAYIGFITDNGEAIVYTGNDLDDPTNIAFNGIYQTGIPLGKTPFINWSGDLIIMTNKGFISAHSIFANGENQSGQYIFSQLINTWLLEQSTKYGNESGFYGIVVPQEDFVLFNIPQGDDTFVQVCMNITSGKWSLFNNINAHDMCVFGGSLYFAKSDGVYIYDDNSEFDDQFIPLEIWTSYNNCGSDFLKRINMLNLRHSESDDVMLGFEVYKDFENQSYYNWSDTSSDIESIGQSGFYWSNSELPDDATEGTAYWNEEYWAGGYADLETKFETYSVSTLGHNFSVKITANVKGIKHKAIDLMLLFNTSKSAI